MFRVLSGLFLLAIISSPAFAQSQASSRNASDHPPAIEPSDKDAPNVDGTALARATLVKVSEVAKSDALPHDTFSKMNRERLSRTRLNLTAAPAASSENQQQPPDDHAELAKKLANPVAGLISVPFQNNLDCGVGETGTCRNTLNVQPVIPISLNNSMNLIVRTIVPIIGQGAITDGGESKFGLGDTVQSFFFSPKKPVGGLILAVGPVGLYPTATSRFFGPGKWGAGPTAVVLKQSGPWTTGMLVNHIWSFAGPKSRGDVNSTFLQPFISHTSKSAWTVGLNTESTYDWENESWSVPLILNASKVTKLGGQPVSIGFGPKVYVARPNANTPKWGIRFIFTLLYPKRG
jgi:hypothetical protein